MYPYGLVTREEAKCTTSTIGNSVLGMVLSDLAGSKCQGFIYVLFRQRYKFQSQTKKQALRLEMGQAGEVRRHPSMRSCVSVSTFHVSTQEHTVSAPSLYLGPSSCSLISLFVFNASFVLQPTLLRTDFIGRSGIILLLNCISKACWYLRLILTCGGKERKAGGL